MMSKSWGLIWILLLLVIQQCKVSKVIPTEPEIVADGIYGLELNCASADTINTLLISKAETIITFNNERYESSVTLFVWKDSLIYLSAVNSGFEIIRASIDKDSIKVIDRINRTVYRTSFFRKFGYQLPVNFSDLQNVVSRYFLCDDFPDAKDDFNQSIEFSFPEENINKTISLDRTAYTLDRFNFYHTKTNEYIIGERTPKGLKILSNFMINDFEILGSGGEIKYNKVIRTDMRVNARKYSFVDLQ